MKLRAACALGVLALLALTAASAQAQTSAPKRVVFKRGKAVVQGTVSRNGRGGDYVLRARSGQTLVVNFSAAGETVFSMTAPDGENMAGEGSPPGRVEFQLTQTGDYKISVINRDGRRRSFTFTLRLR